ncbi:amidohydrolase family protein [Sulfurirhabdus autotrophica]|uniref:Mannonate dehydratase n=1 Tax=Sulfurirhabdus autotrophica TaxID=1706046 RepID=A0A4R3YC62_9PROT|nr:amidohydrolase [Sulfurirhabdus autotrophica]TCV89570.1 mannonate dehydratase [Sulfurirhabdus autotrophica]
MNRRNFMRSLGAFGFVAGSSAGWKFWPEQGLINPCLANLPGSVANHPLMQSVWSGLDSMQVWDCHVHLVGGGDSNNGVWFSPAMDSLWHPILKLQKLFYMNAGCVHDTPGHLDQSYVDRMLNLVEGMRPGFKAMLFAFDWFHDEAGRPDRNRSIFHIPDHYAAQVAHSHPETFEWVASIHPYRTDCVAAVQAAVRDGAKAIKWLPSAMGIDPLSPRCDRFYEALAAVDMPIISHAGRELAVQGGNQDFGNPLRLRRAMDHGVRVVIAHCASDGDDQDIDQGANGPRVKSYDLFARMMDESRYAEKLYADISALTQLNRVWALKAVLQRDDWHSRLLNGSDYPLPGVMPLFSATDLANMGLLDSASVPFLQEVRLHNPLLFDFALKRLVSLGKRQFPSNVFETRRFFERKLA